MTDAGQHGGPLLHLPGDAVTHVDKGFARLPHLARTARPEIAGIAARTKTLCRFRQIGDRPDLVAQENRGNAKQQNGRQQHQHQQKQRTGCPCPILAGQQTEHSTFFHFDTDIDIPFVTLAVDPERLSCLKCQIACQAVIDEREPRSRQGFGQNATALDGETKRQSGVCQLFDPRHRRFVLV